ncbi:unnamed protein product [Ambrosiozyma monospora]|uniref:Unnamed protein product n=1 Tax=Ambrosiozyma monospora TaxID=43982 RepID=A0A9W7DIW6_AMBMO|nr:unnamed protein product [Ambrosiozyma monospora]
MPIHYMIDNPSSPMFSIEPIENITGIRELTARALAYGVMPKINSTEAEIRTLIKHRIEYLTEFKQAIYASRSMSSFSPPPPPVPEKQISMSSMKQILDTPDTPAVEGEKSQIRKLGTTITNNSEKDTEITVIMSALLKEIQDFNVKIEKTNDKVSGIEQSISSILISSASLVSDPTPVNVVSKSAPNSISDETAVPNGTGHVVVTDDDDTPLTSENVDLTSSTGNKDSALALPPAASLTIIEMQRTVEKLQEQLENLTLKVESIKKTTELEAKQSPE